MEVLLTLNAYKLMEYFVGHAHVYLGPPCLKRIPTKMADHPRDTFLLTIAICNISRRPPLYHFNLPYLTLCLGAPDSTAVLEMRPDEGFKGISLC